MSDVTRRAMIHATVLVPFQAVRGSAQNSAIKVGLIGAGNRGSYTGAAIAKDPGVKVTAICDVDEEQIVKARARIGNADAKGYKNYQDVLSSDVDAVMIATPVYLHPDHFEGTRAQRTRYGAPGRGVPLSFGDAPSRPVRFKGTRAQRTCYGAPGRGVPLSFGDAPSRPVRF